MPKPLAICIEDLDAQSQSSRYLRCVALPGRQPGLRLDEAGKVVWQSDDGISCELWVSADERLILYRSQAGIPVTLHRAGRSLDVPCSKPVVVIDQDQIDVGARHLRVHVHGAAPAVTAPSFLAPTYTRRTALAMGAGVTVAAVVGAATAGCACTPIEVRDNPPEPTIEIRENPPEMPPPTETPSPTFTIAWGDPALFQDAFERMKAAYPAYAESELESMPTNGDPVVLLQTACAAGAPPDIAEVSNYDIFRLVESAMFVDLTERIEPYKGSISPALLEGVTWNGRVWAVPYRPYTAMLWYNKAVFDEAGIGADSIETWDDFLAAGRIIRDFEFADGLERYIHSADADWVAGIQLLLMLQQQCSNFFDPETGEVTIDTDPHFRTVMQWWDTAYKEGILLETTGNPWESASREIAAYISGNWMDEIIRSLEGAQGQWRAMKLPAWEPGASRAAFGAYGGCSANVVVLNGPQADGDLAWAFVEHSFLNLEVTGDLMAAHRLIPAYLPAFDHPYYNTPDEFYGGQVLGLLDKEIQQEATCGFHYTEYYEPAVDLISVEVGEMWAGIQDVDQAIADAAAAIRVVMDAE
jgi:lactose/L-arabinose transport system substrate-binding protein